MPIQYLSWDVIERKYADGSRLDSNMRVKVTLEYLYERKCIPHNTIQNYSCVIYNDSDHLCMETSAIM